MIIRTTIAALLALTCSLPFAHAQDDLAQRVERLATYSTGASRVDLVALEKAARGADEATLSRLESLYVGLLDGEHTDDARAFALRQLVFVGTEACVPTLGRALAVDGAVHLACEALAAIGGSTAAEVAAQAVEPAGELRPEIVRLLGDLEQLEPLLAIARDRDRPTDERIVGIAQLARFAQEEAVRTTLLDAYTEFRERAADGPLAAAEFARVEEALLDAAVLDAVDAVEWGFDRVSFAADVYRFVERDGTNGAVRLRALRGSLRLEPQSQVGRLLLLLAGDDPERAGFAAQWLADAEWKETTAFLAAALPEVRGSGRDHALRVLAERGGAEAAVAVGQAAAEGELAAIDALGTFDGLGAYEILVEIVGRSAEREDETEELVRARAALDRMPDSRVAVWLRKDLIHVGGLTGPAKTEVIEAYARRVGGSCTDALAGCIEMHRAPGADPIVALAAWKALEQHASVDFDRLMGCFTYEREHVEAAGRAVTAFVRRQPDPTQLRDELLTLAGDQRRDLAAAVLPALALVGGPQALQHLRAALADPKLAPVAVDALGSWPDGGALEPLLTTISGGAEELRRPAFDASLRLGARLGGLDPTAAGGVVTALWAQATDADERAAVLGLAGTVPSRFAADTIAKALGGGDAVGAAVDAAVALAPRLGPSDRYGATELLEAAAHAASTAERTAAIDAAFDAVDADEDFLLAWRLAGPFEKSGVQGAEIMAERFAPEIDPDDPAIVWRDLFASEHEGRGIFDLNALLNATNATAYVRTHVWSGRAQSVRLELGSDDGLCVWLNGAEIHRNDAQRGLSVGSDVVVAKLKAGWNALILEVTQGGGDWGFCCRLRGTDRRAASGWRCDRFPRDTPPPAGAVVLVGEGAGLDAWTRTDGEPTGWSLADRVLTCVPGTGSVRSSAEFGDATIHVEFAVPHEPDRERGQGQGNSGVYAQGRYEVQVLNSFGLPPHPNECGSIYGVAAPAVNMAARPGEWQTYDIEFTAARWVGGDKVSDARLTVLHNGVLIHDDVRVPSSTGAGAPEVEGSGPLVFQDHGHELRFRNVWVLPHDRELGEGAVSLVTGDGLEGWVQRGGDAAYVRDGDAIVGATRPNQPNSFLCTESAYGDFTFEFEFLIDSELNSGVQVRSLALDQVMGGRVHGYQVEIDPSERSWTAGIYDESRRGWLAPLGELDAARAAFRDGEWNRVRVYARGDVLRTWLNGQPCAVLVDGMTPRGFIGLQVHGVGGREDALEVRWRGLRIAAF